MKIAIVGLGQLGKEFLRFFETSDTECLVIRHSDVDIINLIELRKVISSFVPNIIINCSAYNDVDGSEINKDIAFKTNAIVPKNLAILAEEYYARLIHFSTDFVFDGKKQGKYTELDKPNPLSYYGYTKLCGENFIKETCRDHLILRTSWLYGDGKQNLIYKLLQKIKNNEQIMLPPNKFGIPTSCTDVVIQTHYMIKNHNIGLYHCVSEGEPISIYDYGKTILNIFDNDVDIEYKINNDNIRPNNSSLDNFMMRMENIGTMPHWKKSLEHYIRG